MKTNTEIINYFLEIMHPFSAEDVRIISNDQIRGILEIPHAAWDFIIFELMK